MAKHTLVAADVGGTVAALGLAVAETIGFAPGAQNQGQ
jgi:hypothetical protein